MNSYKNEILTVNDFINNRPDMAVHSEQAIQSAIYSAGALLNSECNGNIEKVWEYNKHNTNIDINNEWYRNAYELGQLQEAFIAQTQYNINLGNDFSQGGGSYSIGNINSSFSRPAERDTIAPGVIKLLQNARVYQLQSYFTNIPSSCTNASNIDPYDTQYITYNIGDNRYVSIDQSKYAKPGDIAIVGPNNLVSFVSNAKIPGLNELEEQIDAIVVVNNKQDENIKNNTLNSSNNQQALVKVNDTLNSHSNLISSNATSIRNTNTQLTNTNKNVSLLNDRVQEISNEVAKKGNFRGYYSDKVSYHLGDTVVSDNYPNAMFISLQDNNLANPLNNDTWWKEVGATDKVDLSNYYTKSQVDSNINIATLNSAKTNTPNTFTQPQTINTLKMSNLQLHADDKNNLEIKSLNNNANVVVDNVRLVNENDLNTAKSDCNSYTDTQVAACAQIQFIDISGKELVWDRTTSCSDYCYVYSTHWEGNMNVFNGSTILSWLVTFNYDNLGNQGINVNVCPALNGGDSWYGLNFTIVSQQGANKKYDNYNDIINNLSIRIYYLM